MRRTFPMYREMGSLLEDLFNQQQREDSSLIETSSWAPAVDIKEEKGFCRKKNGNWLD